MPVIYFLVYLLLINFVSAVLFAADKNAAVRHRRRTPERTLHLFEMLGGAFANLVLMYVLRHKNRKTGYRAWTWLMCAGWTAFIIYLI